MRDSSPASFLCRLCKPYYAIFRNNHFLFGSFIKQSRFYRLPARETQARLPSESHWHLTPDKENIVKSIVNKTLTVAFFGLIVSSQAVAESKINFEMKNGSSVLMCERTEPVPESDFINIFGHWQTYIMKKHQEGVVYLSQYTQVLNKGIVIVINKHKLVAENVKEAEIMLKEMNKIAKDKGVKRDKSTCKILAMGPIWLEPKK